MMVGKHMKAFLKAQILRMSTMQLVVGCLALWFAICSFENLGGSAMLGASMTGILGCLGILNFIFLRFRGE